MIQKRSVRNALSSVSYLPDRTPQSALTGEAAKAFARLGPYRDGSIDVGHYSGSTEWERHQSGDEIVFVIEGSTTVVILGADGSDQRIELAAGELVVVPQGTWHRFEGSASLKVLAVTPAPTDHSLARPGP